MAQTLNLTVDQGATLQFTINFRQATPTATWTAATDYDTEDVVQPSAPNGYVYECSTAGESGSTEPTWPTTLTNTVEDGTVVWTCANPDVQPVNLSSYTAAMQIRTAPYSLGGTTSTDPEASITNVSTSQGVITLGGATGSIGVLVTGETTSNLTSKAYFYDLFVISPSDIRTMVVSGKITVNNNVTVVS